MVTGFLKKLVLGRGANSSMQEERLPAGVRIYAVGDIHGRLDLLKTLYKRIDEDRARNPVTHTVEVFLGDYVDRGPNSAGVLQWFLTGPNRADKRVTLLGNHEFFLLEFLNNASVLSSWGQYGGLETLHSYGLKFKMPLSEDDLDRVQAELKVVIPAAHLQFMQNCQLSSTMGGYFFAHAGVNPAIALKDQVADDLLWIRDAFLEHHGPLEKVIVHGHTPSEEPEIEVFRIGVDTGAYITGRLTCAVLEGNDVRFIST